ncbi:MAG: exodeoxyribonuclease VII large subunit, partial [Clostridia bacterium]|nr:exodeoxyribonuclease VII large subunit [Clostridia bacterium]
DFTICDFVADRRAPTPSAAAELAVPDTAELKRKINNIITRESDVLRSMLRLRRERLDTLEKSRALTDPMTPINDRRMTADQLQDRLMRAEENILQMKKAQMAAQAGKLNALNPLSVLSRGYSAVYKKEDGKLVRTIDDVQPGDEVAFKTIGGEAICTVNETRKK